MQLKWCLTLLATVLLAGNSANASIVIDDFSDALEQANAGGGTGPTELSNGIIRTMTASPGSFTTFVEIGNGLFNGAIANNFSISLLYDFRDSDYSGPRNFFVDQVLSLGFTGNRPLNFGLTVTSSGATEATALINGLTAGIDSYQFNMLDAVSGPGGNGHLAAFANVDTIELTISNTSGASAALSGTGGIVAVPEPTTMALLTPLMLGGVFYRRRKAKEADQAKI